MTSYDRSAERREGIEADIEDSFLPTVHHIPTGTHGRYLVDCPDGVGPFPLLVGFHGYGENAAHMLDVLGRIRGECPWLLVSVQALNRFYNRSEDAVVASWMTREDRKVAIADNVAYISAVLSAVRAQHSVAAVFVVGFSQGVAMAYRAAVFGELQPQGVIVLAGDVPPDVVPKATQLPPVLVGRGATDGWYTEAKATADLEALRAANVEFTAHVFEGGHVWDATFIARATSFIESLLP